MAKFKKLVTTPVGDAKFPTLNKPDTKFDPDGVYKVDLLFDGEAVDEGGCLEKLIDNLEARLDEFVEELKQGGEIKPAKLKKLQRNPVYGMEEDENGEETGQVYLRAKLKAHVTPKNKEPFDQAPAIFDTVHKDPLKKPPQIWGGSKLQLSVEPRPYYSAKDNVVGITLRLKAVRIIELVTGGGGNADSYGFGDDDIEGYAAEETEEAPFDDDDDDGDDDDDSNGDGTNF